MALGTAKGPTRFGLFVRARSAASTIARVDGPPDPMMMPVRAWEISSSSRPASRIAWSIATWFQAAPPPRNRRARRSMVSSALRLGAPCTWHRKPSSAYLSARRIPDLASRKLASTSWVLLPMDETMPIPVTTTRLMIASSAFSGAPRWKAPRSGPGPARLRHFILLEQAHFQVERPVDHRVVGGQPAVRNAEHQFRPHHALHVDAVDDLLDVRKNLAGELE